jgi:hypothetical protein
MHLRVADKGAGDRQHLLFAPGQLRPLVPGALQQCWKRLEQPEKRPGPPATCPLAKGDEVALQIECVVDGGMDTKEALGGSS